MSENKNRAQKTNYLSFILITAIVIVIVVIFAYIAVMMLNSDDEKNETPEYVSSTTISQTDTIVSFEDDEEVSSEVPEEYTDSNHPKLQGTWQKTNVYESKKAILTITRQDNESFDFTLKIWSGKNTAEISGTAGYTGENTAVFKKDTASITFDCGSKYLSVYHTGQNSIFGLSSEFTIDGKFTQGTPNYYKKDENTNNYDYNTYKSAAVVKSLKSTLSADDYSLYTELMETGLMSPIAYERTVDKNGKNVNVDTEMKCVKYYASNKNIGINMIMICSNSGKIYVLFYDASEMSYYTNDKNYSSKMPQSFQTVADSKGIKPTYK